MGAAGHRQLHSDSPTFFELTGDCVSLISSGTGPFASSLLGVSATEPTLTSSLAHVTPQVDNGSR